MYKLIFISLSFSVSISFGQTKSSSDSLINEIQISLAKSKRLTDSILHPIKYAKTLEDHLFANFPENSNTDGRWVYYKERAKIEKLNKPLLKEVIQGSEFYKVTLTNFLGYHINQGTCIIVFDSVKAKITFSEPLWYSGTCPTLIKLFIGYKFSNKDSLSKFLTEFNELLQIGSFYKFRQTSLSENIVTFDLGYFKGDTNTTGGIGTSSTINYNEDGVWRKIIINVKDLAMIRYTSINPIMNDKEIIE
jgi:hypothetical protein